MQLAPARHWVGGRNPSSPLRGNQEPERQMRPRKWASRQGNDAGYLKNTDVWFNAEVGAGFEI